jgi:hypothetical protein
MAALSYPFADYRRTDGGAEQHNVTEGELTLAGRWTLHFKGRLKKHTRTAASPEGVARITPERKLPGGKPWSDLRDIDGRWDEHGPRCKYCGGPAAPASGPGEGFAITGSGHPRIAFRCALGWHPECRSRMQTISYKKSYRALLPIGRQERVYHDVLAAHSHFEGVFDSWRDRYAVSGTSNATRSKRRLSIQAQQLRGAAALLAE